MLKLKKKIKFSQNSQLYLMSAIPLFLVFLFSYVPMFGIIIAFKKYRFDTGVFGSEWIGFKNFEFFLKSNDFLKVAWNTVSLNFLFIIFGILGAVFLAIIFYELKNRALLKTYQTIFIIPHFLSWVVVAYMAYAFLEPQHGILNNIIRFFGGEGGTNWYATPGAWPYILTIASVWKVVGMDCIIFYASLMGMDVGLIEAAKIDGANRWHIIRYIIIPQLLVIISIMTILKVGGILRADFGLFYQLTMDAPQLYSVTDVIDTYIYRTMRQSANNMGISTALGFLQSAIGLGLVLMTDYFSKKVDKEMGLL